MSYNKLQLSKYDSDYHDRQYANPYQSTINFCDWLVEIGAIGAENIRICDLGCGKGANLYYMSKRFPHCSFVGLDIDEQLINDGRKIMQKNAVDNCSLSVGDLHRAGSYFNKGEFSGIISLQTLSWLQGYEKAFDAIISLSPRWIAITSLFYDGPIEAKIVVTEFDISQKGDVKKALFYNTYSLPLVRQYFFDRGYRQFKYIPFEIPIDLPRNKDGRMQTYTEKIIDGRRLQISGPLLMNWFFIYVAKE